MNYNGGMDMDSMGGSGGYGDHIGYGGYADVYRHNATGPGGVGVPGVARGKPGHHSGGHHPFFGMQVMAAAASTVGLGGENVVSKSRAGSAPEQQAVGTVGIGTTYRPRTTYVYRDFASVAPPKDGIREANPNSLQARKLPTMLSSMLSDSGEFPPSL